MRFSGKKEHIPISQLSQNSFMFNACVIDLKNKTAYNYIFVVTMHNQTNFSDKTHQLPLKSLKAFYFLKHRQIFVLSSHLLQLTLTGSCLLANALQLYS